MAWTPRLPHPSCARTAHQCRGDRGEPDPGPEAEFRAWSSPHQPERALLGRAQALRTHAIVHGTTSALASQQSRASDRLLLSLSHPHISRARLLAPRSILRTVASSSQIIMGTFCSSLLFCQGQGSQCGPEGRFHPGWPQGRARPDSRDGPAQEPESPKRALGPSDMESALTPRLGGL